MNLYQKYCTQTFDKKGRLCDFSIQYPPNFNFGYDVVDEMARLAPQQTALVWCNAAQEEKIFTFAQISSQSNRLANVLAGYGIGKGDCVMVMLKRHYEYWFAAVALHKLGAIMLPVTHMLTQKDVQYRVDGAGVRAAICSPEGDAPQKMRAAQMACSTLEHLFTVQQDIDGFVNLTHEMAAAPQDFTRRQTLATDPLVLYFTSGTTGEPKGVIHDHTYPLAHILTAKYWQGAFDGGLHFTVAETGWAKASWGKLYGQWLVGSAVMVFDFDSFDPKLLVDVINRYGVTSFCAPPTVYRYLVKKGVEPMPRLRHVTTAGEALNPEVFRSFEQSTGLTLMEGFGQTESTLLLANLLGDTTRPGSMGRPSPFYDVRLVDEDGKQVADGQIGEIVVAPPKDGVQHGIFCGYWDNDALYRHVWRGGVYHTGDTAWRDEDGYFWFNGRRDDVIKTGGFRVGPFEVENVLMEHSAVLECSVVGVADPLRGQAIKAFVVLAPGYEASLDLQKQIRTYCNARLAEYKWVRSVCFVSELPKTVSGKIKKTDLRKMEQKKSI